MTIVDELFKVAERLESQSNVLNTTEKVTTEKVTDLFIGTGFEIINLLPFSYLGSIQPII